jgi:hypothetical protein
MTPGLDTKPLVRISPGHRRPEARTRPPFVDVRSVHISRRLRFLQLGGGRPVRADRAPDGANEAPLSVSRTNSEWRADAMASDLGNVWKALAALVALYAAFFIMVTVARRHAHAEQAALAAERQIDHYRATVSGARTATPSELNRFVAGWLREGPAPAPLPLETSARLAQARGAAGNALIARVRSVLAAPGYLDPDERVFLSQAADSVRLRASVGR